MLLRLNVDYALSAADAEFHDAVNQRKERVVLAHSNAVAGVMVAAALTDDYVARTRLLSCIELDAEPLGVRVTPVS